MIVVEDTLQAAEVCPGAMDRLPPMTRGVEWTRQVETRLKRQGKKMKIKMKKKKNLQWSVCIAAITSLSWPLCTARKDVAGESLSSGNARWLAADGKRRDEKGGTKTRRHLSPASPRLASPIRSSHRQGLWPLSPHGPLRGNVACELVSCGSSSRFGKAVIRMQENRDDLGPLKTVDRPLTSALQTVADPGLLQHHHHHLLSDGLPVKAPRHASMTEIYPSLTQCAVIAAAFKILLFPA